jgi:hypothetical protein
MKAATRTIIYELQLVEEVNADDHLVGVGVQNAEMHLQAPLLAPAGA